MVEPLWPPSLQAASGYAEKDLVAAASRLLGAHVDHCMHAEHVAAEAEQARAQQQAVARQQQQPLLHLDASTQQAVVQQLQAHAHKLAQLATPCPMGSPCTPLEVCAVTEDAEMYVSASAALCT